MPKEIVHVPGVSDGLLKANVPISAAVKANGFVFVSGQPPIDPETGTIGITDVKAQTHLVLNNVKSCLEAAGSSMEQVVKVTIFITNAAYFATVNEIYKTYFPQDPPARTFVTMASWPMTFDVEIECIAVTD
ncbi:MAG: Rid family detoxifying hydrolase [Pseudomonadota bacterium]